LPPSITICAPVMFGKSSEARASAKTAISSAVAIRFWPGTFAFAQFAAIASQTASGSYRAAGAADEFGVRRARDQRVDADIVIRVVKRG
jgi:hypothetical protein